MSSPIIEVFVGIILIYLILSMVCSAINEVVQQAIFKRRGESLWEAIRNMLQDPEGKGLAWQVYKHPMIQSLAVKDAKIHTDFDVEKWPKPSYIPSNIFALALGDVIGLAACADATTSLSAKLSVVERTEESAPPLTLKKTQFDLLRPLLDSACGNVDQARKNIEDWFNASMERASGLYKRRTQKVMFYTGLLVAFMCNADSLMMVRQLWASPVERAALIASARNVIDTAGAPTPGTPNTPSTASVNETGITQQAFNQAQLSANSLFGWSGPVDSRDQLYNVDDPRRFPNSPWDGFMKVIGLVLTALAVSFGAPLWFDLLKKFMNPRLTGTITPPSTAPPSFTMPSVTVPSVTVPVTVQPTTVVQGPVAPQ